MCVLNNVKTSYFFNFDLSAKHILKEEEVRANYTIVCEKQLGIEAVDFVDFRDKIKLYLIEKYYHVHEYLYKFETLSLNAIALDLFRVFDLQSCEVWIKEEMGGVMIEKEKQTMECPSRKNKTSQDY